MSDPSETPPAVRADQAGLPDTDVAEPYDPADYRWVPVRRRPRYDGWTEEKQRRFIEALVDTGVVGRAARAVGMTRESAYQLRRAPHAAAFARAWDAARDLAGATIEDVAFERALEGVEQPVFNEHGETICSRRVYNDRLLMFLLRHLKPERYGRDALREPAPPQVTTLEASLSALEPPLPAPPHELLDAATLADELQLADAADGALPAFLSEQRPTPSPEAEKDIAHAARLERGKRVYDRIGTNAPRSQQELGDLYRRGAGLEVHTNFSPIQPPRRV